MSSLEIYIGKSRYMINCQEDEEEKIKKLASKLNERVNALHLKMRDGDEKTILMLSSLMIEAELDLLQNSAIKPIENSLDKNESRNHQNPEKSIMNEALSQEIDGISFMIESLANKILKC